MIHHSLDLIRATEAAAVASFDLIGHGNEHKADQVAVEAMRGALKTADFSGKVVIGEGERDQAPMLFIGEKVGAKTEGSQAVDIALDPLEGTKICANHGEGSMSVIALTHDGGFLHAPDVYMEKIVIGSPQPVVSLANPIDVNLENLAKIRHCKPRDLTVAVLQRDRHKDLIAKIRDVGSKIKLIPDGDISASILTVLSHEIDMYIGIGGAPEGVLAASALKSLGGYGQARLLLNTPECIHRARSMGIEDPDKVYEISELVKSDSIFVATGVTSGRLLAGVTKNSEKIGLQSLVITKGSYMYIDTTTIIPPKY